MPEKTLREALVDVADAIRAKTESQETMTIEEMPGEIASIITPTGTKNIVANGDGIDVYNYASVNVNVPNPSSGTLEITENGDGIDVSQYAYVDVDVQGGGSFEANYLYPTDENGAVLSDQGQELDDTHIYYNDSRLTSYYPSSGSVYFFENNTPHAMDISSDALYYYDGNPCGPLSAFESLEDGHWYQYNAYSSSTGLLEEIYGSDTDVYYYNSEDGKCESLSTEEGTVYLRPYGGAGSEILRNILDGPITDGYYYYSSSAQCLPLSHIYFSNNVLYYMSSEGMVDSSGSVTEDVICLVNCNSDRVSTSEVGNLAVGQEVTRTIYRNGNNERYKITRLTDE